MYIIYLFLLEFLSSFLEDKNGAQKCNLESHDFHQVFLVRKLWGVCVCVFQFLLHFIDISHSMDKDGFSFFCLTTLYGLYMIIHSPVHPHIYSVTY